MKHFDRFLIAALATGIWTLVAMQATSIGDGYAAQSEAATDADEPPAVPQQLGTIQASDVIGLDALIERSIRDQQRPQSIRGLDQYVKSIVRRCRISGSVRGDRISSASITC